VVKRSPSVSKTGSSRNGSANGKYVPSKTLRKTLPGKNSRVNSLNELLSKSKSIQGKSGLAKR
ncbi:hypothetical protein, partial [Bacillus subtilis]|uniref:hypothetical protein n=1 Tax=Bacillus subtilis TaxID=1423 RepID=UPI003F6E0986